MRKLVSSQDSNAKKLRLMAILLLIGISAFAQQGANYPNSVTQSGFVPGGSYEFSQFESIDKASGNLSLHIPITTMPIGRAGFTLPITLIYNSSQFAYNYMGVNTPVGAAGVKKLLQPSPWNQFQWGYDYRLYSESNATGISVAQPCNVAEGNVRTSIVTPDGARHVLYRVSAPIVQTTDAFYPWNVFGQLVCSNNWYPGFNFPSTLPAPQTLVTRDGTYIRVVVTSLNTWMATLPDGTTINAVDSGVYGPTNETITDKNGNKITLTESVNGAVIQDDLGRKITMTSSSTGQQTLTKTGFGGSLSWTFGPVTGVDDSGNPPTEAPFKYLCIDLQNLSPGANVPTLAYFLNYPNISYDAAYAIVPGSGAPYLLNPQSCSSSVLQAPYSLQVPGTPNPLTYQFTFGAKNGELTRVTLPTGAQITYTYQNQDYTSTYFRNDLLNPVVQKQLVWTDTSDVGSVQRTEVTSYAYFPGSEGDKTLQFTITAPDNGKEVTYLDAEGKSVEVVAPNGDTDDFFYYCTSLGGCGNPYVVASVHSIAVNGALAYSSLTFHSADLNGNPTGSTTYDWVPYSSAFNNQGGQSAVPTPPQPSSPCTGGCMLRAVTNIYTVPTADGQSGSNDPNAYWNTSTPVINELHRSTTANSSGALVAASENNYDSKGNLIEARAWDNTLLSALPATFLQVTAPDSLSRANASVTTLTRDAYGNILTSTDPNGNVTSYTLDANNLYPVQEVDAYGTAQARTFEFTWDKDSNGMPWGFLVSKLDADNNITTGYSYDLFGRPNQVIEASGSPLARQTNTIYNDSTSRVTVKKDLNVTADRALTTVTAYDQLGRVRLTKQLQNAGQNADNDTDGIKVQTHYLYSAGASYKLVSNPYCGANSNNGVNLQNCSGTSSAAASEQTMGWTLITADTSGRPVSIATYDGASLPAPFGGNQTLTGTILNSYSAQGADNTISPTGPPIFTTTSQDQAGNIVVRGSDGLGRLVWVKENAGSSGLYATKYSYDPLGDLTSVAQSGQIRSFVYDSLKRLSSAANPESGTIKYTYYAAGNLHTKTDARGNITTLNYDALNRLNTKSYSVVAGTAATPNVTYTYGTVSNNAGPFSLGKLISVSNVSGSLGSTTTFGSFDQLGRPNSSRQTTGGYSYNFPSYNYNLAGSIVNETFPSGRVLAYAYDGLDRISGITTANGTKNYLLQAMYWPHGAIYSYLRGNNLAYAATYNSLLQPTEIDDAVGGNPNALVFVSCLNWGLGGFNGSFSACAPATTQPPLATNNGNLLSATTYTGATPAPIQSLPGITQTFSYDGLNRIFSFTDNGSGTPLERDFRYDAYGNMWVSRNDALLPSSVNPVTPTAQTAYDPNTNRLVIGQGVAYDMSGNQTTAGNYTLTYDAENRQYSLANNGGPITTYVYDGDGRRVEKIYNSVHTIYVYDVKDELMAEYTDGPVNNESCVTCYLSYDHLGSTRMVTDQNAQMIERHDYMPFGEEIINGYSGRGQAWGMSGNLVNQKFTGKERDQESGLDYFGARYYGSALGRWTSPDWSEKPEPVPYADLHDPQTLNLYGYLHNNPLSHTDPDGHADCGGETNHSKWFCFFNALGLNETQTQKVEIARTFYTINPTTQNGRQIDPSKMSDAEVLAAWKELNDWTVQVANQGARPDMLLLSAGVPTVYRGGSNLQARPGVDVKVDSSGMVQPGRGISVNADPAGLQKFGGARQVESIPPELEIVQRGQNANHFEIAPKQPMTLQRFQELLNQVKLK